MKKTLLLLSFYSIVGTVSAQIDTTSYPAERRELLQLLHQTKPGQDKSCGDLVAVGPKGDISTSRQQWVAAQGKQQVVFKSVTIVPGTEIIRVYNGTSGVVNFLSTVSLVVAGKDIKIKVRRLEVYHRTSTGWCMVAGQGTQVDESMFPVTNP